jgi:hypothetical protein
MNSLVQDSHDRPLGGDDVETLEAWYACEQVPVGRPDPYASDARSPTATTT